MAETILIVDDDAGIRDTAKLVLSREGYDVLTAPDGQAALELMAKNEAAATVSVLLCDLEMPNIGGKELIRRFRTNYPDIPIIVMSGASDTAYLDGIVQEGVGDWIRKPVTREGLLEKVRTATKLFALRKQYKE